MFRKLGWKSRSGTSAEEKETESKAPLEALQESAPSVEPQDIAPRDAGQETVARAASAEEVLQDSAPSAGDELAFGSENCQMLIDMGFDQEEAATAIQLAEGNFAHAVELLIRGGVEVPAGNFPEGDMEANSDDLDIDGLDAALTEALRLSDEEEKERAEREQALRDTEEEEERELQALLEESKQQHKLHEYERQRQSMQEEVLFEKALRESVQLQVGDEAKAPSQVAASEDKHMGLRRDVNMRLAPLAPLRLKASAGEDAASISTQSCSVPNSTSESWSSGRQEEASASRQKLRGSGGTSTLRTAGTAALSLS